MTAIIQFNFVDKSVRVLDQRGDPWFVLSDVCEALGIANSRDAASRLDEDEKGVTSIYTPGGTQELNIVNVSGLYSLTYTSRKPAAKAFVKWVTTEVLPSLMKQGSDTSEWKYFSEFEKIEEQEPPRFLRDRFTEECLRLGFGTPDEFANSYGWSKSLLFHIMKTETFPKKIDALHSLLGLGFDVPYLMWGQRSAHMRAPALLSAWSALPEEKRALLLAAAAAQR
jgi:prophage antirepressor-like protein